MASLRATGHSHSPRSIQTHTHAGPPERAHRHARTRTIPHSGPLRSRDSRCATADARARTGLGCALSFVGPAVLVVSWFVCVLPLGLPACAGRGCGGRGTNLGADPRVQGGATAARSRSPAVHRQFCTHGNPASTRVSGQRHCIRAAAPPLQCHSASSRCGSLRSSGPAPSTPVAHSVRRAVLVRGAPRASHCSHCCVPTSARRSHAYVGQRYHRCIVAPLDHRASHRCILYRCAAAPLQRRRRSGTI